MPYVSFFFHDPMQRKSFCIVGSKRASNLAVKSAKVVKNLPIELISPGSPRKPGVGTCHGLTTNVYSCILYSTPMDLDRRLVTASTSFRPGLYPSNKAKPFRRKPRIQNKTALGAVAAHISSLPHVQCLTKCLNRSYLPDGGRQSSLQPNAEKVIVAFRPRMVSSVPVTACTKTTRACMCMSLHVYALC